MAKVKTLKSRVKAKKLENSDIEKLYSVFEHEYLSWEKKFKKLKGWEEECLGGRVSNALVGHILHLEKQIAILNRKLKNK